MVDSVVALNSLVLETAQDSHVGACWFETEFAGTVEQNGTQLSLQKY